jgi:hypothetical protein
MSTEDSIRKVTSEMKNMESHSDICGAMSSFGLHVARSAAEAHGASEEGKQALSHLIDVEMLRYLSEAIPLDRPITLEETYEACVAGMASAIDAAFHGEE